METTTTTGSGDITLGGAYAGFRTFSSVCSVGDTCYYMIEALDGSGYPVGDWEAGLGTYSATNTLTRTTVKASSNANAAVTLSAGTKRVAISPIAALVGSQWELAASVAASGSSSVVITGLDSYSEFKALATGISTTGAGFHFFQASVDGGATYFTTSGDYMSIGGSGVANSQGDFGGHSTSLSTAINVIAHVQGNVAGLTKIYQNANQAQGYFANSSLVSGVVNAIKFGSTGGNFTAGTVLVLGRR